MKALLAASLILFLANASATSRYFRLRHNPPPPTGPLRSTTKIFSANFDQKLDHFDENEETTWSQRYFVNTEFYNEESGNVVFLMLGGEGDASITWMSYGSWMVNAQKYGALMFQLEHRFYGDSQPFSDLTTEHLRYLSSEQALADAANFVQEMNKKYDLPSDVKWIVFGGSYSGSLAAWMRLKYPELVQGAVAASGPLLAKMDFSEYFQVVVDDLAGSSKECVESLTAGMKQVDDLLSNPSEAESLTAIFNLCEPIEQYDVEDVNVENFYMALADVFALTAQYNGLLGWTIDDVCTVLTDEDGGKEINRLADAMKLLFGTSCVDYNYDDEVESLKSTEITGADRQWYWQTCTEYGWYQTTIREDKVFGKGTSLGTFTNLCVEAYGPEFNETFINRQIEQTNAYYGGLEIDVSNVVHVHGSLDPWHAVGLLEATNVDSPVLYVEGTSHCAIMYETDENEPPALTAAREEVDRLIGVWLGLN